MKKQAYNPYLPSWEYIPDGEPYVFGDRVYVYGSHDRFGGYGYCQNDYVCWSAPVDDLGDWRYEGVIYRRNADPMNQDGDMYLFAPDVTVGADGRYYLYYVLDQACVVSVAVCDTPAGTYEFYGYVHYEDGTRLGEREGDEPQFDPGVLTEGEITYLYTGFCMPDDESRHGAMLTVLGKDMLTIREAPRFVVPSKPYEKNTGYEGHAFFEASSIRRVGEMYYFIYSSVLSHELCYATGESPYGPFTYGGTIVSNCDLFIDSYKPAGRPMYYGGNNHGSIVQIRKDWYIFYHRHTNGQNFGRQGCIEKIQFDKNGKIPQVTITTSGMNPEPLSGNASYPAVYCCNLTNGHMGALSSLGRTNKEIDFPYMTCEAGERFITNIKDRNRIGYKYINLKETKKIEVIYQTDTDGELEIYTELGKESKGIIKLAPSTWWKAAETNVSFEHDRVLYLVYRGQGSLSLITLNLKN